MIFKIPLGTRVDFFEICKQFGDVPAERFASSGLVTIPIALCCPATVAAPLCMVCVWAVLPYCSPARFINSWLLRH